MVRVSLPFGEALRIHPAKAAVPAEVQKSASDVLYGFASAWVTNPFCGRTNKFADFHDAPYAAPRIYNRRLVLLESGQCGEKGLLISPIDSAQGVKLARFGRVGLGQQPLERSIAVG